MILQTTESAMKNPISGTTTITVHPLVTALLCVTALLVFFIPCTGTWLQYDRSAIAHGEIHRLFTGHLAHWTLDHLVWDALMLAVLGAWCERINGTRTLVCLAISAATISAALWFMPAGLAKVQGLPGQLHHYRGLSGIDSALLVMLASHLLGQAWGQHDYARIVLISVMLFGFGLKVTFETMTVKAQCAAVCHCRTLAPPAKPPDLQVVVDSQKI